MSGNRLPLLPLGARSWYPCAACAYCGATEHLRPQVMLTYARALVCADTAACERRRYWKRQAA
jgi:alpha-D-ribose 1-methylphosphonate 5-phosphate C-P lyase